MSKTKKAKELKEKKMNTQPTDVIRLKKKDKNAAKKRLENVVKGKGRIR